MLLAALASFGSIGLIACGLLGFSAKFPPENVIFLYLIFRGILVRICRLLVLFILDSQFFVLIKTVFEAKLVIIIMLTEGIWKC